MTVAGRLDSSVPSSPPPFPISTRLCVVSSKLFFFFCRQGKQGPRQGPTAGPACGAQTERERGREDRQGEAGADRGEGRQHLTESYNKSRNLGKSRTLHYAMPRSQSHFQRGVHCKVIWLCYKVGRPSGSSSTSSSSTRRPSGFCWTTCTRAPARSPAPTSRG